MSAMGSAMCYVPPTAGRPPIPAGTTTWPRTAGAGSRAGPRTWRAGPGRAPPPGWYRHLAAPGRAEIQVGAEHLAVSARTADPTERGRLFPCFVQMYKG